MLRKLSMTVFMCGRYTIIAPAPALAKRFNAKEATSPAPNYNAAPSQALGQR